MAEYRSETSSFQNGDHLAQNRRHRLNSALTLGKLPSLKVMRPKRVKIQLFNFVNFLWGRGGEGGGRRVCRLVMAVKFCVFQELYIRSVFNDSLSDLTVITFSNALFSAVTTDFHRLVLVKSWNGFLYRNIT